MMQKSLQFILKKRPPFKILGVFMTLMLLACHKDHKKGEIPVTVEGYVVSLGETDSIKDCLVELYEVHLYDNNSDEASTYNTVQTTKTDSSGHFQFSFLAEKDDKYYYALRAVNPPRYAVDPNISFINGFDRSSGGANDVKIKIEPLCWAKINISDSPNLQYDSVKLFTYPAIPPPHDTIIYESKSSAYPPIYLQWSLYKNGSYERKYSSVGCAYLDTTTINIFY